MLLALLIVTHENGAFAHHEASWCIQIIFAILLKLVVLPLALQNFTTLELVLTLAVSLTVQELTGVHASSRVSLPALLVPQRVLASIHVLYQDTDVVCEFVIFPLTHEL